ncbi:MAG: Stp1/IreP family PP2C-type Ser/Thr phosphatase [Lachnospiraceae bacterium]|nr:Stp1/IreP family PP2C-type Ser/Thr phosphatase [Lachnospiraceae bacterium]
MFKTFSLTDVGKKREINQDYMYTSEMPVGILPNLFIVADGMGGHKAGDYASRCAVDTIVESIQNSTGTDAKEVIRAAVDKANAEVHKKSFENDNLNGMGTTLVVATCTEDMELLVANVGDSRLYIVGRDIEQITKDHSLVEEMIRRGGLSREDARNHPDKNVITRAIGVKETVEIDFFERKLNDEDTVLMCSDGLTNMVEDHEIKTILDGGRDIVEKAQELVNAANENGGRDNITVILIEPLVK